MHTLVYASGLLFVVATPSGWCGRQETAIHVRADYYSAEAAPQSHLHLAESVAAIVSDVAIAGGTYVHAAFLSDGMPLCEGTPLRAEQALAGGAATGTVVGPRAILTARHVLCGEMDLEECRNYIFSKEDQLHTVFGWRKSGQDTLPSKIGESDVYAIVDVAEIGDGVSDWAIGCVDRDFVGHPPLDRVRLPRENENVFSFAHPFGVHLQYVECAQIHPDSSGAWTTLDAVPGFSGAPVFGLDDHLVGVHFAQGQPEQAKLVAKVYCPGKDPKDPGAIRNVLPWDSTCCPARHGESWSKECGSHKPKCRGRKEPLVCCQDFRPLEPLASVPPVGECSQVRPERRTELRDDEQNCVTFPTCEADGCCGAGLESRAAAVDDRILEALRRAQTGEHCGVSGHD